MRPRNGFPEVGTKYWLSVLAISIASARATSFSTGVLVDITSLDDTIRTGEMYVHLFKKESVAMSEFNYMQQTVPIKISYAFAGVSYFNFQIVVNQRQTIVRVAKVSESMVVWS